MTSSRGSVEEEVEDDDSFFIRNQLPPPPPARKKSKKIVDLNSDSDHNSSDGRGGRGGGRKKRKIRGSLSDLEVVIGGEKKKSTTSITTTTRKEKNILGAPRSLKRLIPSEDVLLDSDSDEEEDTGGARVKPIQKLHQQFNRRRRNLSDSPEILLEDELRFSLTQLDRGGDALSKMAIDWKGPERIPLAKKLSPLPPINSPPPRIGPTTATTTTTSIKSKKSPLKPKSKSTSKPKSKSPPTPPSPQPPPPPEEEEIQPPTPLPFWEARETKTLEPKKRRGPPAGQGLKALASLSKLRDAVGVDERGTGRGGEEEVEEIDSSDDEERGGNYETVADKQKREKAEGLAKLKASREAKSTMTTTSAKKVIPLTPIVANPFEASKIAAASKEKTSTCGICLKNFPDSKLANHAETCFEEEQAKLLLLSSKKDNNKSTKVVQGSSNKLINREPSPSVSPPPVPALRTSKFRPSTTNATPNSIKNALAYTSKSTSTSSTTNAKASTSNSTSTSNINIPNSNSTNSSNRLNVNTTNLSRSLAAKSIQDAQIAADLGWSPPPSAGSKSKSISNKVISREIGRGKGKQKEVVDDEDEDYFNEVDEEEILKITEGDWEILGGRNKKGGNSTTYSSNKGKGKVGKEKILEIDNDNDNDNEEDYFDDDDDTMEIDEDEVIGIEDDEEEEDDDIILMGNSTKRNSNKVNSERRKGPQSGSSPPKGSIYISTLPKAVKLGYTNMYTIKAPKAGKSSGSGIGPLAPQKMSAPYKKKPSFKKGGWKRGPRKK